MDKETESKALMELVLGKIYDADLRKAIIAMGMKRFGTTEWISSQTNSKYEVFTVNRPEGQVVSRLDVIEGSHRIHLRPQKPEPEKPRKNARPRKEVDIHGNTRNALLKQLDSAREMMETIQKWNKEMKTDSNMGQQLRALTGNTDLSWDDFMFMPDPLCSGRYLFANIGRGKVSQIHAWVNLPGGEYIVPIDSSTQGAFASLATGLEFHRWEFRTFTTVEEAITFTLQMLNGSDTNYVMTLRKMIHCELRNITVDDMYRNARGQICRVETTNTAKGIIIDEEVPIAPTLADCIDALIAPIIVSKAIS